MPAPDAPVSVDSRDRALCDQQVGAIQQQWEPYVGIGGCVGVVRVDADALVVEGYQVRCGPYAHVTEASARSAALADTGFGRSTPSLVSNTYVFVDGPPHPRGVALVNDPFGLTVFGASVGDSSSAGQITFPSSWLAIPAFDPMCIDPFEPTGAVDLAAPDVLLTGPEVTAALAAARTSGVPTAFQRTGGLIGSSVFRYSPTFEPGASGSKWLVLLAEGWLE